MEKEKTILKEEIELKQKILNFFNKNDVFYCIKNRKRATMNLEIARPYFF